MNDEMDERVEPELPQLPDLTQAASFSRDDFDAAFAATAAAHQALVKSLENLDFAPMAELVSQSQARVDEIVANAWSDTARDAAVAAQAAVTKSLEGWDVQFDRMIETLGPALESIQAAIRLALDTVPDLSWIVPPNLRGRPGIDFEELTSWMKDEGLPVAYVLDTETVDQLIHATSAESRRNAITARRSEILTLVAELLGDINDEELRFLGSKVQSAVRLIRSGEHDAAQALAASVIDTALRAWRPGETRDLLRADRRDPDNLPLAHHFIVCQLWGAYQQYFQERGDPIPTTFNRHATAHSVSPAQYTVDNALLAVAHAASILLLINAIRDASQPDE